LEAPGFDDEQEQFLGRARVLRVATISSLGDPLNVPVRFCFDGEAIYFTSPEDSPQIVNLRGNRRVCVLVDSLEGDRLRGLAVQGLAQFVRGEGEKRRVAEAIAKKYGKGQPDEVEGTVVRISPVRVMELSWDKEF
jgi:nitroimidazol reductase NimA-like FMN-containing flavoprotein (pyridoxamine 5'-phosphate oxidase superfamily)